MDNFLSNSLKFTEKGNLKLGVSSTFINNKEDSLELVLKIEDTGIGMEKEKIDNLFQAFSQVHQEGLVRERGTGLGLYISKQIIFFTNILVIKLFAFINFF